MAHETYKKGIRLLILFVLFLVLSFTIISQTGVQAANLSSISDTLSSSKVSTVSNHTITFRSATGVSSGTIVVNLTNVVASAGSVDYTDIDLQYSGIDAVLGSASAANTWGVSVAGGLVTFSYPTSCTGACAAISRGATVTIYIGTNANGGNAQMTNVATAGSKYVSVVAGSDMGLFAVPLLSSTVSVSGTADIPSGTSSTSSTTTTTTTTATAPTTTTTATAPESTTPQQTGTESAPPTETTTATAPTTTTAATAPESTTPQQTPAAPVSQPTETPTTTTATTPKTEIPPVPAVVSAPIAASESIVIPPAPITGGGGAPYLVGVTNAIGGGGASALVQPGTFLAESGTSIPVIVSVSPMPFDLSAEWTGCSGVKKAKILGKIAYSLQAKNSAPKNPGDVAVDARRPVQFTIQYSQKDVERQGFNESTIRPIAFDPEDCDQKVAYTVDTEKNTVTITVVPKTFFALTGDIIPGFVEKETIEYPTFEFTPVSSPITTEDLNLKDIEKDTLLSTNDEQFIATSNSIIDMCLASKLFKKPVKKIILSVGSTKYSLQYDEPRDCFGAKIKIPPSRGTQDVELKIIYIDDQVQIIKWKTVVTSEFQANLLKYALPFLNQIQAINEQVGKTVEQNEQIIQTAAAISVPVVGVANPSLVTNALNWYYYINHFFSWLLSLLGIRKKRRSWGVVYNAITKTPIDLVIIRLFEKATNRLIETQVTDKSGRFSFLAPPGEYYITATKNPLIFPSHIVRGSIDGDYTHIYRQESFTISTSDQAMTLSIPLDPPAFDHEAVAKKINIIKWWKTFVGKNPLAPLLVGFIMSELLVLYIPTTINYTLLGFNGFFLVTQVVLGLRSEKAWGLVFDAMTLAPIPLAAITIFDAREGKMLLTRLTDYFGRFSFLTPSGKYMLVVTKEGYQFPAPKDLSIRKYAHLYHGEPFDVKGAKAYIKTNIPIVPQTPETESAVLSEPTHSQNTQVDLPPVVTTSEQAAEHPQNEPHQPTPSLTQDESMVPSGESSIQTDAQSPHNNSMTADSSSQEDEHIPPPA